VATIQTVALYLGGAPALIYSLFAGALSDDFGRKPLMIIPMIGVLIGDTCLLFNYMYIETIPLEFFYTEQVWFFFGGISVMYLGVYGYIGKNHVFGDMYRAGDSSKKGVRNS
jgi:MFS family permease